MDWDRVARERIATAVAEGVRLHAQPGLSRDLLRQALVLSSFADGKPELILGAWRAQAWTPRGPVEIAAVADALAFGGEEAARPFIGALARYQPVEADVALARLLWRQRRFGEAAAALEKAFVAYRADPWPLLGYMKSALSLAVDVGSNDAPAAARLFAALSPPFAARVLEEERLMALAEIGLLVSSAKFAEALALMEPNIPWLERTLERRVQAYETIASPRLSIARRDLERFRARGKAAFAAGLD